MSHYSDEVFEFTEEALARTVVIKVAVDDMTGKGNGY
jgi:hypothetical protein